jgi:hypothetical protein
MTLAAFLTAESILLAAAAGLWWLSRGLRR